MAVSDDHARGVFGAACCAADPKHAMAKDLSAKLKSLAAAQAQFYFVSPPLNELAAAAPRGFLLNPEPDRIAADVFFPNRPNSADPRLDVVPGPSALPAWAFWANVAAAAVVRAAKEHGTAVSGSIDAGRLDQFENGAWTLVTPVLWAGYGALLTERSFEVAGLGKPDPERSKEFAAAIAAHMLRDDPAFIQSLRAQIAQGDMAAAERRALVVAALLLGLGFDGLAVRKFLGELPVNHGAFTQEVTGAFLGRRLWDWEKLSAADMGLDKTIKAKMKAAVFHMSGSHMSRPESPTPTEVDDGYAVAFVNILDSKVKVKSSCVGAETMVGAPGGAVRVSELRRGAGIDGAHGRRTVGVVASVDAAGRRLFAVDDSAFAFSGGHPFRNAGGAYPALLAVDPDELLAAVPSLAGKGVGRLAPGSRIWRSADGGGLEPHIVGEVREAPSRAGGKLYDVVPEVPYGEPPGWLAGDGKAVFLVAPEIPTFDGMPLALRAVLAFIEGFRIPAGTDPTPGIRRLRATAGQRSDFDVQHAAAWAQASSRVAEPLAPAWDRAMAAMERFHSVAGYDELLGAVASARLWPMVGELETLSRDAWKRMPGEPLPDHDLLEISLSNVWLRDREDRPDLVVAACGREIEPGLRRDASGTWQATGAILLPAELRDVGITVSFRGIGEARAGFSGPRHRAYRHLALSATSGGARVAGAEVTVRARSRADLDGDGSARSAFGQGRAEAFADAFGRRLSELFAAEIAAPQHV